MSSMRDLIRIIESQELPHIFYHATSTKCYDQIKSEGLLADPANKVYPKGHNAQSLDGVYLATNFQCVLLHAENAVRKFGGKPLIFIIRGDIAHTNIDEDHLLLFMQDFLETVEIPEDNIPEEIFQKLSEYYVDVFDQPAPKTELFDWLKHVLEYGDQNRSEKYHSLIDAVAHKTSGDSLDFVPPEDQSVRYIGNIGFSGSPYIAGALEIDNTKSYGLRHAEKLPAKMLFGNPTEELLLASQVKIN